MKIDDMKLTTPLGDSQAPGWLSRFKTRMFNLNDSRWGRADDKATDSGSTGGPTSQGDDNKPAEPPKPEIRRPAPNAGPPDLDELWRDLNRKLGGLFGKPSGGNLMVMVVAVDTSPI